MNETKPVGSLINLEPTTIELFQVERREYVDQHGFSRREPFKVNAKTATIQADGTAKDEDGLIYSRSKSNQSKWYGVSYSAWRSAWSGQLGEDIIRVSI